MGSDNAGFLEPENSGVGGGTLRTPEFDTVRRGFDQRQVLAYLEGVAQHLDRLAARVNALEAELAEKDTALRERGPGGVERTVGNDDPYQQVSSRVADLMRAFDQDVERLRRDARAEADRSVAEARAEAERVQLEAEKLYQEAQAERDRLVAGANAAGHRVLQQAQEKADQMVGAADRTVRDAEARAKQMLAGVTGQRETLQREIGRMRDQLAEMVMSLEAAIDAGRTDGEIVIVEESAAG